MKIGITSYSISRGVENYDHCDGIKWASENGAECYEISGTISEDLVDKIKATAEECGIELSSYTIGANFVLAGSGDDVHEITPEEWRAEVDRVKKEVEIGAKLGVKRMRHDVASRPIKDTSYEQYEKDLKLVVPACAEIADHALQYGITTSTENHGYHFQGSERVKRLVLLVNRPNYRTTLDVGNFICSDEDSVAAVKNNIDMASFIHFKDFFIRKSVPAEEGWFKSRSGKFLRGAITGNGDLDLATVSQIILDSGYDGYVSVEVESLEDVQYATRLSIANVRALLKQPQN